jgi:hypothetical protein
VAGKVQQHDPAPKGGVEQREAVAFGGHVAQVDDEAAGLGLRAAVSRKLQPEGAEDLHDEA